MNNMEFWGKLQNTPKEAQKPIDAGRLKGFTDINPMWRLKALTELFGPCGTGWKLDIKDFRIEDGTGGEKKAFVFVTISYKHGDAWSEPVPGFGGAAFVAKEKSGLYVNDECFKMALSDAIGTACKALGMSADIFFAKDRSKYTAPAEQPEQKKQDPPKKAILCQKCGKEITGVAFANGAKRTVEEIIGYSEREFGVPLCYACTKESIRNANAQG